MRHEKQLRKEKVVTGQLLLPLLLLHTHVNTHAHTHTTYFAREVRKTRSFSECQWPKRNENCLAHSLPERYKVKGKCYIVSHRPAGKLRKPGDLSPVWRRGEAAGVTGTRGHFRGTLATSETSSDTTGSMHPPAPRRSPGVSPTHVHRGVPRSLRATVGNKMLPEGPEHEDELAGPGVVKGGTTTTAGKMNADLTEDAR